MPDEATVLGDHDGVDRTQARGIRHDLVELGDDDLLARVGDVEPVEPQVPSRPQQRPDRVGAQAEDVQVDGAIDAAQPVVLGLALVNRGSERRQDAVPDQSGEVGLLACAHGLAFRHVWSRWPSL